MKKYLILIALLLIPFIVNAEVKITHVEFDREGSTTEQTKTPTFEGLDINFDLNFDQVGETAKYKITLENDTNKDYEIETGSQFSDKEYLKYEFSYDEKDTNVLKSNENKTIDVVVSYNKAVPLDKFVNGVYNEDNAMAIILSSEEQENPLTKSGYIMIAFAVLLLSLLVVLFTKFKLDHVMVLLIAGAIIVPLTIYALEKITINVSTKVEILSPEDYFTVSLPHCGNTPPTVIKDIKYLKGMTFEEFFNSDYSNDLSDSVKTEFARAVNGNYAYKVNKANETCRNEVKNEYYHANMTQEEQEEYAAHLNACNETYGEYSTDITANSSIESQKTTYYSRDYAC